MIRPGSGGWREGRAGLQSVSVVEIISGPPHPPAGLQPYSIVSSVEFARVNRGCRDLLSCQDVRTISLSVFLHFLDCVSLDACNIIVSRYGRHDEESRLHCGIQRIPRLKLKTLREPYSVDILT